MRHPFSVSVALVLMLGSSASPALAQHDDHGSGAAPRAEKLGKVHFDNSCSPSVGQEFDRAMALLHSFEFAEAIAGYQTVLKSDASCGIAEWGIAMATWGNPPTFRRSASVSKPLTRSPALAATVFS